MFIGEDTTSQRCAQHLGACEACVVGVQLLRGCRPLGEGTFTEAGPHTAGQTVATARGCLSACLLPNNSYSVV